MKILIIGGYGNVGSKVVSILDATNLFSITIGGLNLVKATNLANNLSGNVSICYFDALNFYESINDINNSDIIISCIDLIDEKLAEYIIKKGKIYIDITANYNYINKIEQLSNTAIEIKGLGILSVGIVPGLSNLMIKHLQQINYTNTSVDKAEIFVQLGLGDKNGKAAVQWVLNNVNKDYIVKSKTREEKFRPFINGRKEIVFNKSFLYYPFNFSDQHVVCNTLNINKATSYLGFDSNLVTIFLSFLKRIQFFKLLKIKFINNFLLWVFTNLKLGNDLFTVKAMLFLHDKKAISLTVSGSNESLATAQVVCVLLKWIHENRNNLPKGIKHLEEILTFQRVIKEITIKKQEIAEY